MYCTRCGASIAQDAAFCPACGNPVVPVAGSAPAVAAPIRTAYAGFWLRFVAWIIDALILSAAGLIVLVPLAFTMFRGMTFERPMGWPMMPRFFWFWPLNLVGAWLYYALFESSTWQATPGKRVLGLLVTDMQGRSISFPRASARFFGKILSWAVLMIGYIMAGFTAKKQALHDILADCLVLRRI
ncbi:MAG: RDD family protein [Acidobacteriota bacterium]|nr:RDD family protein [Acidobacteriota bacterium]